MFCLECQRLARRVIESELEYITAQSEFLKISGGPAEASRRAEIGIRLQAAKQERARWQRYSETHVQDVHSQVTTDNEDVGSED